MRKHWLYRVAPKNLERHFPISTLPGAEENLFCLQQVCRAFSTSITTSFGLIDKTVLLTLCATASQELYRALRAHIHIIDKIDFAGARNTIHLYVRYFE